MWWQNISRGVIIWIPSPFSMVPLPISSTKIPRWNKANPFYRFFSSITYPPSLISRITHNIIPLNVESKSIIRPQTPSLTKPVIPDMCVCMPFWFGLLYLTVWMNLPMDTNLLLKFPLLPPLTSASLCTINYETLFTNMIQRTIFLAPRSNTDTGLVLHKIVVMPFLTVS